MDFQIIKHGNGLPKSGKNVGYLMCDNWDDYGFKTLFQLVVFDEKGVSHEIGSLKISYIGHTSGWTEEKLESGFEFLTDQFYSLGLDVDYYTSLLDALGFSKTKVVLSSLNDIALDVELREKVENEEAFVQSLLRGVSHSSIELQFQRILKGEAALSKYNFTYSKDGSENYSEISLNFKVFPNSKPSTNMHVLIGKNGVGKTTILNNMTNALVESSELQAKNSDNGKFIDEIDGWLNDDTFTDDYFAGLVSISFSAFDSFEPPAENNNPNKGRLFSYIGLKKDISETNDPKWILKDKPQLGSEFAISLINFLAYSAKKERWLNAIRKLGSDSNFRDLDFDCLIKSFDEDSTKDKQEFNRFAKDFFDPLSSGHAIVLLSITKLVEKVEEKTIVLLDEPESHLHPPLLSAFTRALNDLLVNRNGLAIIATHSPVVLQEIPKSCVNILIRNGIVMNVYEPEIETFAENVGILTREVFRLEVSKSGFHDLLSQSVDEGKNYEEIINAYEGQIGFEGKALLRSLILSKKNKQTEE